jgi:hypothetical protein
LNQELNPEIYMPVTKISAAADRMLIHNMYNVFILHQRQTSADKQTNLLAQGVACVLLRQFQLNL